MSRTTARDKTMEARINFLRAEPHRREVRRLRAKGNLKWWQRWSLAIAQREIRRLGQPDV